MATPQPTALSASDTALLQQLAKLQALVAQSVPAGGSASGGAGDFVPGDVFNPQLDGGDYFWITVNPGALAADATASVSYQLDSTFDFYWIASSYMADLAGVAVTDSALIVPLETVLIYDGGSRRQLMDPATPINSIASPTAKEPYRLIRPRYFSAASVIKFTFTNYSAATTYTNTYFTLHGYTKLHGT